MALATVLSTGAPALAQQPPADDASDQARTLFEEGLSFADGGDWERAVHRFRGALALRESAPIRFNLARSLSRMGRSVEALGELDRLRGDLSAGPDVLSAASELEREIEARLGRLIIDVRGDAEGAQVTVDGLPIPPERLGAPTPTEPGVRVARLLRGTVQLDVEEVDVPAGGEARVALEAPALALASIAEPAPRHAVQPSGDEWVFAVVTGAVLLAAGSALAIAIAASETGNRPSAGDFTPSRLEFD